MPSYGLYIRVRSSEPLLSHDSACLGAGLISRYCLLLLLLRVDDMLPLRLPGEGGIPKCVCAYGGGLCRRCIG